MVCPLQRYLFNPNLNLSIKWDVIYSTNENNEKYYNIILNWQSSQDLQEIRYYNIYQEERWIGRAFSNTFVIEKIDLQNYSKKFIIYRIEPIHYCYKSLKKSNIQISF